MVDRYHFHDRDGKRLIVVRAYHKTLNGNPLCGQWALYRVETGELLDWDQYRNDLKERIQLKIEKGEL